jgi:hypothetical protein
MKPSNSRSAALILASLIASGTLFSCGEAAEVDSPASNPETTAPAEEIVTEGETTESFDPGLPEQDYGGSTFTILTKGVAAYNEWGEVSIWTESENGEVVNDAIYDRNRQIEETYNIVIAEYQSGSPANDIKKSVSAGDNAYQLVMPAFGDSGSLASGGFLVDLFTLNYVDLSKKWWDQRSVSDLTIGGHLFFVGSDISNLNNDATWCTMFNKKMIQDFNDPSRTTLSPKTNGHSIISTPATRTYIRIWTATARPARMTVMPTLRRTRTTTPIISGPVKGLSRRMPKIFR